MVKKRNRFDEGITPKSSMAIVQSLFMAINALLPVALQDSLATLNESKDKIEHCTPTVITYSSSDANSPKNEANSEFTGIKSPNPDDQKPFSDILHSTSEMKAPFLEAMHSLDLFESHFKKPSQETARQIKLLFDNGKKAFDEFFTADNTNFRFLLNGLRSLKTKKSPQDDINECGKSGEFALEKPKTRDIDMENDVGYYTYQPPSVCKEFPNFGLRNPGNDPDTLHEKSMGMKENGKFQTMKRDSKIHKKGGIESIQPNLKEMQELEDDNRSLRKQVESLEMKNHQYEESLFELEKFSVEENAKRNEERKSELFSKIYHSSSSGTKPSLASTSNGRTKNERLGYPKNEQESFSPSDPSSIETTTASANPSVKNASPVQSAAFNEQSVKKTEEIVQGSVSLKLSEENPTPPTESFTSTSNADGGRGGNGFEDVIATSSNSGPTSQQTCEVLSFSVQQHDSGMENISLDSKPPVSVATTLYNNYKLLLLTLAQRLLASDVVMLKDWAAQNFSIENPQNATDVLFQLDEKRVINASDLNRLSDFFESIIRFDLVYVIDAFLRGDYDLLRQTPASKKQTANGAQNSRHATTSRILNPGQFSIHPNPSKGDLQASGYRNSTMKPGNNGGGRNTASPQSQQALSPLNPSIPKPRFANEFSSITSEQPILKHVVSGFTSHVGVADGPVTRETRAMTASPSPKPSTRNNAPSSQSVGSNGSKHSKFQRKDNEPTNVFNFQSRGGPRNQTPDRDDNWLCSHYKRHCYVKFDCCDKFWPCHRCHNNQSTCGRKKLKSRDTKMLKCVYCDKVQQFGEHCCNCGARFAQYYCGMCKHLTGTDDHPYHCGKCGICRIHGDRSFHCDVCGVCLDVQLRGNHKCREGSAHDECCICLEDAFTGCQILPCSHKVHKECATQMIRSGITRCPICRESFAHKLERRPFPNSRKRAGK